MESPLRAPTEPDFRLIETLAFRPGQGFVRLARHLGRMARSAKTFGIPFSAEIAARMLNAARGDSPLRCRLTLDTAGQFDLTTGPLAKNPDLWRLAISDIRLTASDIWLRHKSTRRAVYDTARASIPTGVDELVFLNERDELCEGTITNLFLEMPDGRYLTPSLSSGVLPGILREEYLENKRVTQATLSLTDLRDAQMVHVGNSLRGLIRAELAVT
ncbi:4-amino-4-deoxychorismate lyase [Ruegeria halocynthiae]|uniref:Probable branched-chain-amino-acid aminotransferase n=1 Tax=Ruegeria halocynthiae TaxID=985054 RepID=A0A1H2VML4_9RHOB|nr:aminotransferase class IV family protein [Ruegeria halocynthiae]SDW69573.1 4-amino-4-deoxychorismate lyase [Ruegeria halocynthiae]